MAEARPGEPLVSVVLCTYEGAPFLAAQMESLLGQTHRNLEVIAIDDGSRDDTARRLAAYAARDERIELIAHPRRAGMPARLAEGLVHARAAFVMPADQDDEWEPTKVETLLREIGDRAAIYSASALIDAEGRALGRTLLDALGGIEPVSGRDPWALFWRNTVSGHAVLFRTSLVAELLPFARGMVYDHQIALLATVRGGLAYTDAALVRHRVHARNQITRLPGAATRADAARPGARRVARRFRDRGTLLRHGAFFARHRLDPAFGEPELAVLQRAHAEFSRRTFDLRLFRLLLRQRARLLRHDPAPLRRAWSTAKSERWYTRRAGPRRSAADASSGAP